MNTHDGDFAERLNVALSWYGIREKKQANSPQTFLKIGYDWRPRNWVNGLFTYFDVYAHHRAILEAGRVFSSKKANAPARFRLNAQASWIMDKTYFWGPFDNLQKVGIENWRKRLNGSLTANYCPSYRIPVGLFAQMGYYGSDPYNIYFLQSFWFYRIGFSLPMS